MPTDLFAEQNPDDYKEDPTDPPRTPAGGKRRRKTPIGDNYRETSRAAYESTNRNTIDAKIYRHIVARGFDGSTCDEAEVALDLPHQTCSASVCKMEKAGLIKDSGRKRKTRRKRYAMVMIATKADSQNGRQ